MRSDGAPLTLQEAADRLGVHYMTAYRYVRTGRLPASRDGVQWLVKEADLEALRPQAGRRRRGAGRANAASGLVARMGAGDEAGAWKIVDGVLAGGASADEVLVDIIGGALRRIGDDWATGQLTVAEEHCASAVAQRLIGRLGPQFARPGRKRGSVVVGAVEGDRHGLASAILADVLRGQGFEVLDAGADTPVSSFVDAASGANRLVAVIVGSSISGRDAAIRRTIKGLRAGGVAAPILVGGAAVSNDHHARSLGGDGWTGPDARQALAAIEELLAGA